MRPIAFLVVLLALYRDARANVAAPWIRGGTMGEATGISAVTITREELTIDLRPAEKVEPASVRVVYHLDNPGETKTLDLVFISGSMLTTFEPTLDGKPLEYKTSTPAEQATPWKGPTSTPDFDGGEVGYHPEVQPVGFHMVLPTGTHDLVITYRAHMGGWHHKEPTLKRQFVYILAPARTWGGFGGLDLTVKVPPRWRAAASLPLTRTGDTLTGSFPTIPADSLGITVQAPAGALFGIATHGLRALLVLVLLAGGVLLYRRAKTRPEQPFAHALGHALLWSTLVLAVGLFAIFWPGTLLPELQADRRGYGDAFAAIGLMFLCFVLVIVGTVMSRLASRTEAKRRNAGTLA